MGGENMRISVIGLGKLGACFSVAAASRGHEVIGVDVDGDTIDAINRGIAHIDETDYEKWLVRLPNARIRATPSFKEAVLSTDISFIIVPTPSEIDGAFSLRYVASAMQEIGKALAMKSEYHLIVIVSTVLPGSTRYGLIQKLAVECPEKSVGKDYGICYSPEFIALGTVIKDMLSPDMVLIGEFDSRSGHTLKEFYRQFFVNDPPYHRMTLENAELAKIAVNTFVTMKITFANMIQSICTAMPGGNVDHVTDALGCDERIGSKFFKGGLGFGGPCLPRDNRALDFVCRQLDVGYTIPRAIDDINRQIPASILKMVEKRLGDRGNKISETSVLVCGVTYKTDTPIAEESQAVEIANLFLCRGAQVAVADFDTSREHLDALERRIELLEPSEVVMCEFDVIILTANDKRWAEIDAEEMKDGCLVIDCWRIMPPGFACERIEYAPMGIGDIDFFKSSLRPLWETRV